MKLVVVASANHNMTIASSKRLQVNKNKVLINGGIAKIQKIRALIKIEHEKREGERRKKEKRGREKRREGEEVITFSQQLSFLNGILKSPIRRP